MSANTSRPDPLRDSACRERTKRWARTDLHGYPTLSTEEETEETLAAEPKLEYVKKGKTEKEYGMCRLRPIVIAEPTLCKCGAHLCASPWRLC
jgi:hypothetical protein